MSAASPAALTVCDLCHLPLAGTHQHLFDSDSRKLECVCDACAILFSDRRQKYQRVPRGSRVLLDFQMTDAQWDALMIPIGIAFLYRDSRTNRMVAVYPSPAGPVLSQLALEAWEQIAEDNPQIGALEDDVEGLLVYRVGSAREHYIIPVDECFKLIGLIRVHWKGLSGGLTMWQEVGKFLEGLK